MDSPWLFFLRREVTTSLIFEFRSLPSKKRLHTKKHAKACRTCNKTLITFIMQHASRLAACSFINTCNVQNAYNKACKHSLQNMQRTCMLLHQNRPCKEHATYIKKICKERVCCYTWNKTCKQHALQNMQGTYSPLYMQ